MVTTKEKVAVVIAAGSGMGARIAEKLAENGYRVAILSSSGKGESLAKRLGGIGVTGSNLCDTTMRKLFTQVREKWGRVDALINSAGHGPKGIITEVSDEDWHKGMDIYFLNVVRSTRHALDIMQKQKHGAIVNISTFAAVEPNALFPTSSVFRAGLSAYTKIFSRHYAKENVRMNNILPGFIDSLPESKELLAQIPMQRYGKKDEVAELAAFLVSDKCQYITGQNIVIDGGITHSI